MRKVGALTVIAVLFFMLLVFSSKCPASCDDNNPCTLDVCNRETGYDCSYQNLNGDFQGCMGAVDGCSNKTCLEGVCRAKTAQSCAFGISCNNGPTMSPPYEYYKILRGRPSFNCTITNLGEETGRLVFSAELEGYSSHFEQSFSLEPKESRTVGVFFTFPDEFYAMETDKVGTLKVSASSSGTVVHSESSIVQLRKSSIYVPRRGDEDMITLWVTYNDPCIEEFISEAKKFVPNGEFSAIMKKGQNMEEELAAIFYALRYQNVTYVSSTFSGIDEEGVIHDQDVRFPWQSLKYKQMNCIDGAVLYAAILERLDFQAGVMMLPGHALVVVKGAYGREWTPIETIMTGDREASFEDALAKGKQNAGWGGMVVSIHDSLESGLVPMPVGEHECEIKDLTKEAQEYLAALNSTNDTGYGYWD